ncbi:FkbM family methyltransferase, partial [Mycobacterium sp. ITM-2017-0098]
QVVSLIKIDVEGHELQVLEGAVELITAAQPIIVFEQGKDAFF